MECGFADALENMGEAVIDPAIELIAGSCLVVAAIWHSLRGVENHPAALAEVPDAKRIGVSQLRCSACQTADGDQLPLRASIVLLKESCACCGAAGHWMGRLRTPFGSSTTLSPTTS